MKKLNKLSKKVIFLLFFVSSNLIFAQTNTSPTQTVCAGSLGEPYSINPATAGSIYNWTISGGGLIASGQGTDQITVDWNSTPGGPYQITVIETDANGCLGDPVIVDVTIADAATAYAGLPDNVCEGDDYSFSSSLATNYSSLSWTTNGTGTFSLSNILNPVYTPSAADILNGSVVLTLTAFGNSPCSNAVSNMQLTIVPLPNVDAGGPFNICEGSSFTPLSSSVTNNNSLSWTTNGTGTFSSSAIIDPVYTPSNLDISNGSVTLTLTAFGNTPCANVSDAMILTITPSPVAYSGIDADICEGLDYAFTSATASNYSSVQWTSSGTGVFNLSSILNPVYTPSAADIINGSVMLTLTIIGNSPCNTTSVSSSMQLTIIPAPVSNAGADDYICQGLDYTFVTGHATTFNSISVVWNTTGDGTFLNTNTLTPTYTPGTNDILNGSVNLILVSVGNNPCSTNSSNMTLMINLNPITGPINHW